MTTATTEIPNLAIRQRIAALDDERKALMIAIPDWPPLETDDEDQPVLPEGTIDDIADGVRPERAEIGA